MLIGSLFRLGIRIDKNGAKQSAFEAVFQMAMIEMLKFRASANLGRAFTQKRSKMPRVSIPVGSLRLSGARFSRGFASRIEDDIVGKPSYTGAWHASHKRERAYTVLDEKVSQQCRRWWRTSIRLVFVTLLHTRGSRSMPLEGAHGRLDWSLRAAVQLVLTIRRNGSRR